MYVKETRCKHGRALGTAAAGSSAEAAPGSSCPECFDALRGLGADGEVGLTITKVALWGAAALLIVRLTAQTVRDTQTLGLR